MAQAACFTPRRRSGSVPSSGSGSGGKPWRSGLSSSPWCFAAHYYVGADIQVDGQQARASWRLWQLALRADNAEAVLLMARTEGSIAAPMRTWLIDSMRFCDVQVTPLGSEALPLAPGLEALRARFPFFAAHAN